MKKMSYTVIMDKGDEYIFSNCRTTKKYFPEQGDISDTPIIMALNSSTAPKNILNKFEYLQIDERNSNFLKNYKQVLCGKISTWQIISVEVKHHYMLLTFSNSDLHKVHINSNTSSDLPYYQEHLTFEWDEKKEGFVEFHFENQCADNTPEEAVSIYFERNCTRIREYYTDKRRDILLPGCKITEDSPLRMVKIVEYYR